MRIFVKLTTIAFITPSLFTAVFPSTVKAGNQFDVCLQQLVDSGVAVASAQTGCATALLPGELSSCVRNIASNTDIPADSALQNCYRVRRPVDLGNCVVNINRNSIVNYSNSASQSQANTENTTKTDTETVTTETTTNEANTTSVNQNSPVMLALTTCRESLLPARHSECVIGLSRTPQRTSPTQAMETCLKAEDFPRNLYPSY